MMNLREAQTQMNKISDSHLLWITSYVQFQFNFFSLVLAIVVQAHCFLIASSLGVLVEEDS